MNKKNHIIISLLIYSLSLSTSSAAMMKTINSATGSIFIGASIGAGQELIKFATNGLAESMKDKETAKNKAKLGEIALKIDVTKNLMDGNLQAILIEQKSGKPNQELLKQLEENRKECVASITNLTAELKNETQKMKLREERIEARIRETKKQTRLTRFKIYLFGKAEPQRKPIGNIPTPIAQRSQVQLKKGNATPGSTNNQPRGPLTPNSTSVATKAPQKQDPKNNLPLSVTQQSSPQAKPKKDDSMFTGLINYFFGDEQPTPPQKVTQKVDIPTSTDNQPKGPLTPNSTSVAPKILQEQAQKGNIPTPTNQAAQVVPQAQLKKDIAPALAANNKK